jgi:hypothetical protein
LVNRRIMKKKEMILPSNELSYEMARSGGNISIQITIILVVTKIVKNKVSYKRIMN